jgi:diacylglycerol O-acyltransferase / wax synthase
LPGAIAVAATPARSENRNRPRRPRRFAEPFPVESKAMTRKIPLGVSDVAMVLVEAVTPVHIGAIGIYRPPRDAPDDYIPQLMRYLTTHPVRSPPWNHRLTYGDGLLGRMTPMWETRKQVDLSYHVSQYSLPPPGGTRELEKLVSRLHSQPLDMDRPLWELAVIDGLADGRFAMYQKVHHALLDGTRGMRLIASMHTDDPVVPRVPPWSQPTAPAPRRRARKQAEAPADAFTVASAIEHVSRALTNTWRAMVDKNSQLILPYSTQPSIFNVPVTRRRRVAMHELDLARVKAVGRAAGCTVNDVLLAVCGGALRRYCLRQHKALPERSLIAAVPMSVPRPEGELGNAFALIFANLGTNIVGEHERLKAVHASTLAGKDYMQAMPDWLRIFQGVLTMLPAAVSTVVPGVRPFANLVIANIAGPSTEKYFFGARLEGEFGASVIIKGNALNITCTNQIDRLCFGMVACPDTVPRLERLAAYIGESFEELDREVLDNSASEKVRKPASTKTSKSAVKKPRKKVVTKPTGPAVRKTRKTPVRKARRKVAKPLRKSSS